MVTIINTFVNFFFHPTADSELLMVIKSFPATHLTVEAACGDGRLFALCEKKSFKM
jgi:hypothetical protein